MLQAFMHRKRLALGTAALCACAFGAFSSDTHAAIIDSGPVSLSIPNTVAGLYLNLVTGVSNTSPAAVPGWDLNPFSGNARDFFWAAAGSSGCVIAAAGQPCLLMANGSSIGIGRIYATRGGENFQGTGERIVGFRFLNESTSQINYGYVVLSSPLTTGLDGTIVRYVYENTGADLVVAPPPVANTAPSITAAKPLTRQAGSAASFSAIATVSDLESDAGTLLVTAPSIPGGLSVFNIENGKGQVSAGVAASCGATTGANMVGLSVTDGALASTANLTVTVNPNSAPTAGTYASQAVLVGNSIAVLPIVSPFDNGTFTHTVAAPGFGGSLSVNNMSGNVNIGNAGPVGVYTVTVTATDNCLSASTATFQLTVSPPAVVETMYGIGYPLVENRRGTAASLLRFKSDQPANTTIIGPITGLVSNHTVRSIDVRPATGGLYAVSVNVVNDNNSLQLYTLNPATAVATPVGGITTIADIGNAVVSIDFNPVVDRIRLVAAIGKGASVNARLNPDTGALIGPDTPLAYAPGDVQEGDQSAVAAIAYSNNVAGATSTTLFAFDYNFDALVTIGGPNGTPSPNTGLMFSVFVPQAFFTAEPDIALDISGSSGVAYLMYNFSANPEARQQRGGFLEFELTSIDLTTGARTSRGLFNSVEMIDVAVAQEAAGDDPEIVTLNVSRTQGSPWYRSDIALVNDAGGAGAVSVTVNGGSQASANGVSIKTIQNANGTISALVRAGCTATNATFTVTASNGSSSNTAQLNVTVATGGNPNWCIWWPRN